MKAQRQLSLLFFLIAFTAHAVDAARRPAAEVSQTKEGSRLAEFDITLKSLFPGTVSIVERSFLPVETGGSTFMGLVSRLLGEAPRFDTEGLRTKRYLYMLQDIQKNIIGIVHGSGFEYKNKDYHVYAAYTGDGVLKKVWSFDFPAAVQKEFEDKKIWSQFEGKSSEDFEVQLKRISRRKSVRIRPAFLSQAKRPSGGESRDLFEKSMRSLRFNVSFMDVAYFIKEHPDLADKGGDDFPANVAVTTGVPTTGPEAFVRERASLPPTNPFENNKLNVFQNLTPNVQKATN